MSNVFIACLCRIFFSHVSISKMQKKITNSEQFFYSHKTDPSEIDSSCYVPFSNFFRISIFFCSVIKRNFFCVLFPFLLFETIPYRAFVLCFSARSFAFVLLYCIFTGILPRNQQRLEQQAIWKNRFIEFAIRFVRDIALKFKIMLNTLHFKRNTALRSKTYFFLFRSLDLIVKGQLDSDVW